MAGQDAKWEKWDYDEESNCLTSAALSYFTLDLRAWNQTISDYEPLTLEECKDKCVEYNYDEYNSYYPCTGFIVDEIAPGRCWFTNYDYLTIVSSIGECNGDHCSGCNAVFQYKFWNLTVQSGTDIDKHSFIMVILTKLYHGIDQ